MVSHRLPSDTGCSDLTDWRFWEKHGGACPARVDGERPGGSVLSRIHVRTLLAPRAFIDLYISAQQRPDRPFTRDEGAPPDDEYLVNGTFPADTAE